MGLLKNLSLKNLVLTAIATLGAALSVFAFTFGFVGNGLQLPLTLYEWLFEYGTIELLMKTCPVGTVLAFIAILPALFSIIKLVFTVLFVLKPSTYRKEMKKTVIIAFVSTVLLAIAGAITSLTYTSTFLEEAMYSSEMHLPLVFSLLITVSYFIMDAFVKD